MGEDEPVGQLEGRDDADSATPAAPGRDPSSAPGLLAWAVASFHAALLVALAVVALYLTGSAGGILAGLATWVGVVAYLYLWGVTWWTNRRVLSATGLGLPGRSPTRADVLVEASKWGGATGFLAFLPALVVGVVRFVAAGGLEAVPIVAIGAAVGSVLSVGVGVLVGAGFGLLDLLLVRAARRWLPQEDARSAAGPAGP